MAIRKGGRGGLVRGMGSGDAQIRRGSADVEAFCSEELRVIIKASTGMVVCVKKLARDMHASPQTIRFLDKAIDALKDACV